MTDILPLFPLHTVLVPGALLPLRIFETRYLDLVSECLRATSGFGVNLIKQGSEVGKPASVHPTGTYARIVDWQKQPDGLLGITIEGQHRFRVRATQVRPNRLLEARVDWLQEDGDGPVTELDSEILVWLRGFAGSVSLSLIDEAGRERSQAWVSYRLLELLHLPLPVKQVLLEVDAPAVRLEKLCSLLRGADDHHRSTV